MSLTREINHIKSLLLTLSIGRNMFRAAQLPYKRVMAQMLKLA